MKKILVLLLPLLLTGCAVIQVNRTDNQATKQISTGFYKTTNRGETWNFRSYIYTVSGQVKSFSGANVTALTEDPTDAKTLYLGSQERGLLYTTNNGDAWQETLTGQGVVNSIAVDPRNRCVIYAAVFNKVFKTVDCAREWKQIHLSSLEGEFFAAIAIDGQNTRNLYLGTSRGTLLVSNDSGFSWTATQFFPSRLNQLIVNPVKAGEIYAATASSGIYFSSDNGQSWSNLSEREVLDTAPKPGEPNRPLKSLSGANNYLSLVYDPTDAGRLLYSNNYGIFRLTTDGKWQEIKILNKPSQEKVLSVTLNPKNGQELFFITEGAFYQSKNNGFDWTVRKLPTPGLPRFLMVNPDNANELYVAYYKLK